MTKKLEELLPERENLTELLPIATDDIDCKIEFSRRTGYNDARFDCHSKLTQAFKDGTICWGLSEEELEKELRKNFDPFFHQVHFYIEIEDWYKNGIKNTAKALLERMRNDQA